MYKKLLILIISFSSLISCDKLGSNNMDANKIFKYEVLVAHGSYYQDDDFYTVSVDERKRDNSFPMRVLLGSELVDENGGAVVSFLGGNAHSPFGYGQEVSFSDHGYRLPAGLTINYYSYAENQFWHGKFKFPVEKVKAMFYKPGFDRNNNYTPSDFNIIINIAPGGKILVWFSTGGMQRLIGVYSATPTTYDWAEYWRVYASTKKPPMPQHIYNQRMLRHNSKLIQQQALNKNIDFAFWDRLVKPYKWRLVLEKDSKLKLDTYQVVHISSEVYYNYQENIEDYREAAAPRLCTLYVKMPTGEVTRLLVRFHAKETLEIFEEYFKHNNKPLDVHIRLADDFSKIEMYILNDKGKEISLPLLVFRTVVQKS